MRKNIFFQKAKVNKSRVSFLNKKEMGDFFRQQFDQLLEKNIKPPIKLYHL